jgi:small subunit ribosomal protein S6
MDRHFETVYIVNPEIGEEAIKGITAKATELVGKHGGADVVIDEWGRRKLAYPIAKRNDGHYVVLSFSKEGGGAGLLIEELELMFKHNENVMRFQTVVLKEKAKKPEEAKVEAKPDKVEETKKVEAKTTEGAPTTAPTGGGDNA